MKPGITLSNTMTAVAGFLLATSTYGFHIVPLIGVVGGVALVIASACVVNNIIDRDLDTHMSRTKGREIAAGKISLTAAALYAVVLAIIGFVFLITLTNWLTVALGVVAFFWYVVVYGVAKRTTPMSTIIGGVCGALPMVAGYTAVSGQVTVVAWILFGLMMVWQLPHFYAISIFRAKDYAEAKLPIWSVRYGTASTKAEIFFWVVIFALLAPLLMLAGATGYVYLVIMLSVSWYWMYVGARHYRSDTDERWAKRMFGVSLVVLLTMCGAISIGGYLP